MSQDIKNWNPEDQTQWESFGKKVANRNLWISIPALLCGFAVWLYWSIITVQMVNLGFNIPHSSLFSLSAIAGLSGATLRIPSTFFIRLAGGRNTIFLSTAFLIIPALGTGIALQDTTTPLWVFQLLALLSGFGGGNFASSMANISFFFPKKQQGLALGLNAGLGNFGVTTMQILIPLVMTFGIFGGESITLINTSGTLIGKIEAGSETYLHNAALIWVAILVPIVIATWFGMNNINTKDVTPELPSPAQSFAKVTLMLLIALCTSVVGLWFILPSSVNGSGLTEKFVFINQWTVLPFIVILTVGLLAMLPGETGKNLKHQYRIFKNPHTWVMTVLYIMTFGSFIGFSAALPLSIKVIFGFSHIVNENGVLTHDTLNPNGPSALMFAWTGPFIGALIRPVGGWIADKVGGSLVTFICSIVMAISAVLVGYYMKEAYSSATPEEYFTPFLLLFLVLFTATGIGNGSTFRTIAIIFDKEQRSPVLGWTSAIAAYGAFIMPSVIGDKIHINQPEVALYQFAAFYIICIVLNYVVYLRPGAKYKNP